MVFQASPPPSVFARCKEKRTAGRHVRVDLCIQHLEVHLEQRPKQHGHGNKIEEEPSRRREALRGEGRPVGTSLLNSVMRERMSRVTTSVNNARLSRKRA